MNKWFGTGRLVFDPELQESKGGAKYLRNAIAIPESKEITTFVRFTAFSAQAEVIANYLTKGQVVTLEGRLVEEEYEEKKYLKVIVNQVHFVPGTGQAKEEEKIEKATPKKKSSKKAKNDQEDPEYF